MKPFLEGVTGDYHGVRLESIAELGVLVTGLGELQNIFREKQPDSGMIKESM